MMTERLIAEVANVHEGDFSYFKEIVTKADQSGIRNIKFQYIIPDEFGLPGSENYIELNRLSFTYEQYLEVARQISNMNVYYDVYGDSSYSRVLDLKNKDGIRIKGIKFHTTNSLDFELLKRALNDFDTLFISVSGLSAVEINKVMAFADANQVKDRIVIAYGVQNYPTDRAEIKINKLTELKKLFNVKICLTDHLDGDDALAKDIVLHACAMGYDFVEKHITLDRSRRLDDDHAALDLSEIKTVLNRLHDLEQIFAADVLKLSDKEIDYRNKAKAISYARSDLKQGNTLKRENIKMKRQEGERKVNYLNLHNLVGRKLIQPVGAEELLTWGNLKTTTYGLIIIRSASNRLAGKCYQPIGTIESARFLIRRLKKSKLIDKLIVCTTDDRGDDGIIEIAKEEGVLAMRSRENVYARITKAFELFGRPDQFLRLTGDNVFVDHRHIDDVLAEFTAQRYDYYRHEKVLDGCDFEIINMEYFESLSNYFHNFRENSEYMTLYLNSGFAYKLKAREYDSTLTIDDYRFTLDYKEDLDNINAVYEQLNDVDFTYESLCRLLESSSVYKSFQPVNKALGITVEKASLF